MKTKHIGLDIDSEVYHKLKYIAAYEQRSLNRLVVNTIQACVTQYEKEHGIISLAEKENGKE